MVQEQAIHQYLPHEPLINIVNREEYNKKFELPFLPRKEM